MFYLYRLVTVSVLTVHKFYNDFYFSNEVVANLAGLKLSELNKLEMDFLQVLDFGIIISSEQIATIESCIAAFFTD